MYEQKKEEAVIELRKVVTVLFMILGLLSMSYLTGREISVKAESSVLYVDLHNISGPWNGTSEYPYGDVTSALENALDGDTIFVREGTYSEHLVVNRSVSLIGEGVDKAIINGNGIGTIINVTANDVNIRGFTIENSGSTDIDDSAIRLDSSSGNVISNNEIVSNNVGISLFSSIEDVISGNIISNNFYGISFHSSRDNVVSGNTIMNKLYGISFLRSCTRNVVSGNNISSNGYGIYILDYFSNSNIFYHNSFNNTKQVFSASANSWDYGSEGNYWSDYPGRDSNRDGIGDDPYVIDELASNIDNYPLMGMFSDFNITLQRETYDVTAICNSTISDFRFEVGAETGNRMISFNVTGEDGTGGFCRVATPTGLMNYSFVVMVDGEEIAPTLLDISSRTYRYLYFAYVHSVHTVTVISSKTLDLYNQLLGDYDQLLDEFLMLNVTYYELLGNYTTQLQTGLSSLNNSYDALLSSYASLLGNYSQLQQSYLGLNNSYREHLLDYSQNLQNMRNLAYIFAATAAIFLIITIYLSKRAHTSTTTKTKVAEEK